jgi:formate dehydrogenase iron-sulfur subunit
MTWTLIKFFKEEEMGDKLDWRFLKAQCMHCKDPGCVAACPVNPKAATRDAKWGFVYIDHSRCIGCGACTMGCPYGIPHVDEKMKSPKSKKCHMCMDRVVNGLVPACAQTCPTGAVSYGTRDAMLSKAQGRVKELKAKGKKPSLYGLKEMKGLHAIYVLPDDLKKYDLPANPKIPEDVGLLHELLGPSLGSSRLTAAVVGMAIGWLKKRSGKKEKATV